MPKVRNRIKYPEFRQVSSHSGKCEVSGGEVCIPIIDSLVDIAELVQSISDSSSGFFKKRNSKLKAQKKMLCDAIVDSANSLTSNIKKLPEIMRDLFWRTPACQFRAISVEIKLSLTSNGN
jgi:hypothetical protein